MTSSPINSKAVQQGTYLALLDLLDAAGWFPVTREDILKAIAAGVRQAVSEHLDRHGLPGS